jgi:hypothetical protein
MIQDTASNLIAQLVRVRRAGITAHAARAQLYPDQIEYALQRVQLFGAARSRKFLHYQSPIQAGALVLSAVDA